VLAALARTGRVAEALRAFDHFSRVLRNELGTGPAPETMAVYERILAAGDPGPRARPGPTRRDQPLPFLGRRAEVARLATPSAACVVRAVLGEPGIGKSRLLEEAVSSHAAGSVRATTCFRLVAPVPYAVLAELAPDLLSSEPTLVPLPPEAGLTRLATRLAADLEAAPVTLVIDDLQWADEPSLTVLGLVLRHRPAGTTILVAARDGELHPDAPAPRFLELAIPRCFRMDPTTQKASPLRSRPCRGIPRSTCSTSW
jgi:hypothetical protein